MLGGGLSRRWGCLHGISRQLESRREGAAAPPHRPTAWKTTEGATLDQTGRGVLLAVRESGLGQAAKHDLKQPRVP